MTTTRGKRHITREIIQDARAFAHRTQLQAEIALLDKQVLRQHAAFGVAFYDMASCRDHSSDASWTTCHSAVQAKETERNQKQRQIEQISNSHLHSAAGTGTVFQRAQQWVTDTAMIGRLTLECKLLERDTQRLKEQLGIAVFEPMLLQYGQETRSKESDSSIHQLVESVAAEVAILRESRDGKQRELEGLLDEGVL